MGAMRRAPVVAAVAAIAVTLAGAVPAEAAATWRITAEPPLKPASRLVDVSATGAADAWAVGYQDNAYGRIPVQPAALVRWNGRMWSESLLPAPFDSPEAVSAVDPSNVWAAGQDDRQLPYAAHWDGAAWQGYPVADQGRFSDVAARNGKPLIVGARRAGGALVMEWDGQRSRKSSYRAVTRGAEACRR